MSDALIPLPEACRAALEAMQADPLELPDGVHQHLRACPACREARIHGLAQEEVPQALAPAGYFQALPQRILRKLPIRTDASRRRLPLLWAAAGLLVAAASLSGFLAGRANRTPMVEASLPAPAPQVQEVVPSAPFHAGDDVLSDLSNLSPEETEALVKRLEAQTENSEPPAPK